VTSLQDSRTKSAAREAERPLANWQDELESAAIYRAMAAAEPRPPLATLYTRLAEAEESHARFWAAKAANAGTSVPAFRPRWRARTLIALIRRIGPQFVMPILVSEERADAAGYRRHDSGELGEMAAAERSHARLLRAVPGTGGIEGGVLARFEGRHRAAGGNALRAAVLGANDGLVSNLSLVMGVAGASLSSGSILVTGLAGLLAGAGSMALGEWLSVQSSRELYERQLAVEAAELAEIPEEEEAELALIYQAKGLSTDQAQEVARRVMRTPESALDTLAREELGIDPEALGGSAWEAALTSFVLFAVGAIVPVLPYLWLEGTSALVASLVSSTVALFVIGAGITLLTGKGLWMSGGRQVIFGLAAAALTFGVGRLIGAAVAL
jgi:VIT1/CCC1 family predicted Fe2+/Mn2+ transporter